MARIFSCSARRDWVLLGGVGAVGMIAECRLSEAACQLGTCAGRRGCSSLEAMKIAIGADHAGFEMKERVKQVLERRGVEVQDVGTHSTESTDYPPYAF